MKRIHLLILVLLLATAGCKEKEQQEAVKDLKRASRDALAKSKEGAKVLEEKLEDAAVTSEIKLKMAKDESVSAADIDVDTRDGIVTLSGTVKSPEESDRAVEIAQNTKGAKEVISQLKVGSTESDQVNDLEKKVERAIERSDETVADAGITGAIKLKFAQDQKVSALNIDVDTKDGVVTLNGVVKSPAEADRAVELAKDTKGVKHVISKLRVE